MGILNILKTIASPRRAEFTKRLMAKRKQLAQNPLFAELAQKGSPSYGLRRAGLENLEFSVVPEATIVRVLEEYWKLHAFYSESRLSRYATAKERETEKTELLSARLGQIEYRLTGKPDAALDVPNGIGLAEYVKYRIQKEYPNDPYPSGCGITDALIEYAIQESELVFRNRSRAG